MHNTSDLPLVSVVVTTKNEEDNITNCLMSIRLQTYSNIEVIVVDNGSTDNTKTLASGLADIVVDMGPERSKQRNYGICELASGTFAMFVDADMILTPNLIEECFGTFIQNDFVALHVGEEVLGGGLLARVRRFERSFYSGTCIDGVRFFDRKLFCQIGGFDESLPPGPEDWDLDKRFKRIGKIGLVQNGDFSKEWELANLIEENGVRVDRAFAGFFHNESKQTIRQYLRKKTYYSPSMKNYIEKWGRNDPEIRRQLGLAYRYFTVFVENGKWRKLIERPLLTMSMIGLRTAVGIMYAVSRARNSWEKSY